MRVLALILLSGGAAFAADTDRDRALGRQLAYEVERQAKILTDPVVSEYVNRIGQNLVRNSAAPGPFTFRVIEAAELNAFAFPGGYVFVNTGLIKMCDDEAELAAALAHEIAHVSARHLSRQAARARLARLLVRAPAAVLLGGLGDAAARHGSLAGLASFARRDEAEADRLGLHYLHASGYDPAASVSLLEKLESARRSNPGVVARMFSSHPSDRARMERVQGEIDGALPARQEYLVTTSAYVEMRRRLLPAE